MWMAFVFLNFERRLGSRLGASKELLALKYGV